MLPRSICACVSSASIVCSTAFVSYLYSQISENISRSCMPHIFHREALGWHYGIGSAEVETFRWCSRHVSPIKLPFGYLLLLLYRTFRIGFLLIRVCLVIFHCKPNWRLRRLVNVAKKKLKGRKKSGNGFPTSKETRQQTMVHNWPSWRG